MSAGWIKALRPGDRVIILPGRFSRRQELGKVVGISPTGRAKVVSDGGRERIFLPTGKQLGGGGNYDRAHIAPCNQEDVERIEEERERERLAARFGTMSWRDWQLFPLPTLRAVRDLLATGKEGGGARPFNVSWARALREYCATARIPFFMKQAGAQPADSALLGSSLPAPWPSGVRTTSGYPPRLILRDPKGGDPEEWPEDLRVREVPEVSS